MWLVIGIIPLVLQCCLAAHITKRSSVCYGDLGCFTTDAPFFSFHRPLNFLPESPDHINVRFMLYTQHNKNNVQIISHANDTSLTSSFFDPSKPTKVIIHGYFDNGNKAWVQGMKDEYLKTSDYNMIVVDWGGGSKTLYTQATANTRIVGAIVAQMILKLKSTAQAKPEDFHLIGHSLGAHTAGYAGERIQHIGRITGLDPAEPYFQNTDIKVRLDPTDALFVDAIHSNGESILKLGLGMKQPVGHADYFPNGGLKQPGCEHDVATELQVDGLPGGVQKFFACSHQRSHVYFTQTINSKCPFEAYRCNSYDDFNAGHCMPCSGSGCGYMGEHADKAKPPGRQSLVKYFLKTGSTSSFCRYHYQVELTFDDPHGSRQETGIMFVTLTGSKGHTEEVQLTEKHIDIKPGDTYKYVVTSAQNLDQITKVSFRWNENAHWYKPLDWNPLNLRHPTLFVSKIHVIGGESSSSFRFCPKGGAVEAKQPMTFSVTGNC